MLTLQDKARIDESPEVERMGVYEFLDDGSVKKYAVVVGGGHRRRDRMVSVIFLSDCDADTAYHGDEVGIRLPFGDFWVHCGMVTYTRRDRLGNKVAKLGKGLGKRINRFMGMELGILNKTHDFRDDEPNEPDYKKLYDGLLNKLVKAGVEVQKL